LQESNPIQGFDLEHQILRLRNGRNVSDGEVALILKTICENVRSYDQVVEVRAKVARFRFLTLCPAIGTLSTSAWWITAIGYWSFSPARLYPRYDSRTFECHSGVYGKGGPTHIEEMLKTCPGRIPVFTISKSISTLLLYTSSLRAPTIMERGISPRHSACEWWCILQGTVKPQSGLFGCGVNQLFHGLRKPLCGRVFRVSVFLLPTVWW